MQDSSLQNRTFLSRPRPNPRLSDFLS